LRQRYSVEMTQKSGFSPPAKNQLTVRSAIPSQDEPKNAIFMGTTKVPQYPSHHFDSGDRHAVTSASDIAHRRLLASLTDPIGRPYLGDEFLSRVEQRRQHVPILAELALRRIRGQRAIRSEYVESRPS
jgi:hypothetical protein